MVDYGLGKGNAGANSAGGFCWRTQCARLEARRSCARMARQPITNQRIALKNPRTDKMTILMRQVLGGESGGNKYFRSPAARVQSAIKRVYYPPWRESTGLRRASASPRSVFECGPACVNRSISCANLAKTIKSTQITPFHHVFIQNVILCYQTPPFPYLFNQSIPT